MTALAKVKECTRCGVVKALTEYSRSTKGKDGRRAHCKACIKITHKEYYSRPDVRARTRAYMKTYSAGHREINRAAYKRRKSTAAARTQGRAYSAKWYLLNKEKRAAHGIVWRSLSAGVLKRQPCVVCGSTTNIQAHHEDYSKPLEVRWLCAIHHAARHQEIDGVRNTGTVRSETNG